MLEGKLPDHVGKFKIQRIIGEGGMGVVGLGVETEGHGEKRRVAVKILKRDIKNNSFEAKIFEQECKSLARFNHDNIARLYDFGYHEGNARLPYIVMEYVEDAVLITDYCAGLGASGSKEPLAIRKRLELFLKVCDGVRHAHERNVIHRDITPKNILIGKVDGKPVVKMIDFGIALQFEDKDLQERGAVGTPAYMSPEQLSGDPALVDQRSDIYAMGILLCELMVGTRPYNFQSPEEANTVLSALQTQGKTAVIPSHFAKELSTGKMTCANTKPGFLLRLARELRGDIDAIVAKATALAPDERYASVAQLAEDIEEHLQGRPLKHAIPASAAIKIIKFVRRNAFATAASAVILLMVAGLLSLGVFHYRQTIESNTALKEARDELEQSNTFLLSQNNLLRRAQQRAYASTIATFPYLLDQGKIGEARSVLSSTRSSTEKGWEWDHFLGSSDQSEMILGRNPNGFLRVIDAGPSICALGGDHSLWFWKSTDGEFIRVVPSDGTENLDIASDGSTVFAITSNRICMKWTASSGEPLPPVTLGPIEENSEIVDAVIDRGSRKAIVRWQTAGGLRMGVFDLTTGNPLCPPVESQAIELVCWKDDGTFLTISPAGGSGDGAAMYRMWELQDVQTPPRMLYESPLQWGGIAIPTMPEGAILRAGDVFLNFSRQLLLAQWKNGELVGMDAIPGEAESLAGTIDAFVVADNGFGGVVAIGERLYQFTNADDGMELQAYGNSGAIGSLLGHAGIISDLSFAGRGGDQVLSAATDGTVRVWNPHNPAVSRLISPLRYVQSQFASLSEENQADLIHPLLQRLRSSQIGWCRTFVDGPRHGVITVIDAPPWILQTEFRDHGSKVSSVDPETLIPTFLRIDNQTDLTNAPRIIGAGASADGRFIAVLRQQPATGMLSVAAGNLAEEEDDFWVSENFRPPMFEKIALCEDGLWIAINIENPEGMEELVVWDLEKNRNQPRVFRLTGANHSLGTISALAFCPSSKWLAAGNTAGELMLWGLRNDTAANPDPHVTSFEAGIRSIAFNRQTETVAVTLADESEIDGNPIQRGFGFARTNNEGFVGDPIIPDEPRALGKLVQAISWNAAGTRLASADTDGVLRVWSFPGGVASDSANGPETAAGIYLEDCTLVLELRDAHHHEIAVPLRQVCWSSDGRWLASINASGQNYLYYGAEDDAQVQRRIQLELDDLQNRISSIAELRFRWEQIAELRALDHDAEIAIAIHRFGVHPDEVVRWAGMSLSQMPQLAAEQLTAERRRDREAFRDVLELHARFLDSTESFKALALAHYRLGDFRRARSELDRIKATDPDFSDLLDALIRAREANGDNSAAIALLSKRAAFSTQDENSPLWNELEQLVNSAQ